MRSPSRILLALLAALTTMVWPTPAEAASNSFIDDDNSRYEAYIETAYTEGLVNGCNPPTNDEVCPHKLVTRGSFAIMLARAIDISPSSSDHFSDDDGHLAEGAIDGLIDSGIRMGCENGKFCPDRDISRGELATLLDKTIGLDGRADTDRFVDLGDSAHKVPLAKLADVGGLLTCDIPQNERLCPDADVRRDEAIYALVSVLGLRPTRTSSEPPRSPRLDFGDGFYDLSLWDGRSPGSRNRVSITGGGYDGTGLRVSIPEDSHFGADFKLHLDDEADDVPEQLFFRYYLKLDEEWRTTSSGKLPGFSGVYGSSGKGGYQSLPTEPGWSARLMFSPNDGEDNRVDLGYYVYHLGQEKRYGDGLGWNEAGKLRPGDWYCLEGEVELNTPGLADGALRAWVDGTPAFDMSGLEFRRPNEPQIKIESFWFDVYYGGKAVAPHDLGMTIDEVMVDTRRVGCGAGQGMSTSSEADFDGDGYRDRVWWDTCPAGTCFWLERNDWSGTSITRRNGYGAWFSLDSHRVGMATGDVDADGRADIVYHGRCDNSAGCWRVHTARHGISNADNWGTGKRFSEETLSLVLGDWTGDGRDDLAYQGVCGDDAKPCWRVHTSNGRGFNPPRSWGAPPSEPVPPVAADVTGDGIDDLVYQATCEESVCWFAQPSQGRRFAQPVALGLAVEPNGSGMEWVDFDGDSTADLVSWANSKGESWIETRFVRDLELTEPASMATLDGQIEDVAVRRDHRRSTVQLVAEMTCKNGETCLHRFMSPTPRTLVDSERFMDERLNRPGSPKVE